MRRVFILLVLLSTAMFAQQPGQTTPQMAANAAEVNQRTFPLTHSDLYCAGFIAPKLLPRDHFVAAGMGTPHQSRYGDHELIYLRGAEYQPGTRVSIVREERDTNRMYPFPGTRELGKKSGQLYGDIGYATVVEIRGKGYAVAQVDFSCESILAGDLIIPFTPRPEVTTRIRSRIDLLPAEGSSVAGRIVAARDYDQYLGTGRKVYLNVGADRGVKPGDYFRVMRGYRTNEVDEADAAIYDATIAEDSQKNPPHIDKKQLGDLPQRVVGEAIVLSTQSGTATAMITFALEELHVGDTVQLEQAPTR